ncbi:sigma-70 family RNA polymerase sigma factor [Planctomycetes bacterium K23_9]|uniref:RNA polymerase sigma-D factor n=1 Tax=Stieleria marina TaxID=1930275 RepID=A0A517NT18_9BACT|nr:RNA polymerase sigma-D factor [Planctomycetes bacterium K23_9]
MNAPTSTYKRTAEKSRDQLILDNVDYVARILSTMAFKATSDEERENLNSAGVVGLVEAANNFDPSQGVSFRTFAYRRVYGAIVDEMRKTSLVSQVVLAQIGVVKKAHEILEPPVTPERIAEETELTLEQVVTCLEAMRFIKPDDWNDLSDVVHGSWRSSTMSAQYEIESEELKEMLAESINDLPERERLVLSLYYDEELNLAEIGAVLEISQSRVSRVMASARFRLQEAIRCKMN